MYCCKRNWANNGSSDLRVILLSWIGLLPIPDFSTSNRVWFLLANTAFWSGNRASADRLFIGAENGQAFYFCRTYHLDVVDARETSYKDVDLDQRGRIWKKRWRHCQIILQSRAITLKCAFLLERALDFIYKLGFSKKGSDRQFYL